MSAKTVKVIIDPGHAPGNANRGKNGYYEYFGMWSLSNHLKTALERCGINAALTRAQSEDPSLTTRGRKAAGCDLFISEHSNAANGAARGVEVFYSLKIPGDKALAADISRLTAAFMNAPNRGAKTRESTTSKGADYYTVMYEAQRAGAAHVLLAENGFHDNAQDEAILLKDNNLKAIAEIQAEVICRYLGVAYTTVDKPAASSKPILNKPTAAVEKMAQWATNKGAKPFFIALAPLFYRISMAAGVDPVVAYCQSAKETGYGKFGGVLDESFCNTCGMKVPAGGGDYDPNAHMRFKSWDEGIQAQIDHLALYAGAAGYPKADSLDPRHFPYLRGLAATVEALGGKWAPAASYGEDIVRMMNEVYATRVEKAPDAVTDKPSAWAAKAWEWAKTNGICDGTNPQSAVTREQVVALIYNTLERLAGRDGAV